MQRFLRSQGILCNSPKGGLREAFAYGLVTNDPLWLRMLEDRNLTAHTYNEQTSIRIFRNLVDYVTLFDGALEAHMSARD